jgi:uncharacterized membrane-anchored protein
VNDSMDKVQAFRDSVRPILTLLLATGFVFSVLASLIVLLKVMWSTNNFELEVIVALIAILGGPFGMMMTYHFMKASKKDSV